MSARETTKEFVALLEAAERSFDRLRGLPAYCHAEWDAAAAKAIGAYTRLWRFQQERRDGLVASGMERWEVGDIASKTGQLYYSHYMRYADPRLLTESRAYYGTIRARGYFAAAALKDAAVAVKQLRYLGRFVLVALLAGRREEAWQLLQEMQGLVSSYAATFNAPDAADWRAVVSEADAFLAADYGLPPPRALRAKALPFRTSTRCALSSPEVKAAPHCPMLAHVVIAGYSPLQARLGDIPLDCFRMLTALEWEEGSALAPDTPRPSDGRKSAARRRKTVEIVASAASVDAAIAETPRNPIQRTGSHGGHPVHSNGRLRSPPRHVAYRPSVMQLLAILGTSAEALPRDGVLLLYLSCHRGRGGGGLQGAFSSSGTLAGADGASLDSGSPRPDSASDASGHASSVGGMSALTVNSSLDGLNLGPARATDAADAYLSPDDLLHLTRRTLFLIADSHGAQRFASLSGREVSRTAFAFLAPKERPPELGDAAQTGSLLTMFLAGPLNAFCLAAGAPDPTVQQLVDLQAALGAVMGEWAALLARAFQTTAARSPWARLFGDALLRRVILRYVLCRAALALHARAGSNAAHLPRCFPELPREVAPDAPEVAGAVARLAACLGKARAFTARCVLRESEVLKP